MVGNKQIEINPVPRNEQQTHSGGWVSSLLHRWPSVLGIAVAGLLAADLGDGTELSAMLTVMALVYLGAALLARRWSAWVLVLLGAGTMFLLAAILPDVEPLVAIIAASLMLLMVGGIQAMRGQAHDIPLQSFGMVAFGLLALVAFYGNPVLGGYLMAAALFAHAAWDAFHFVRNRVVVRSYAEFCGVLDLLLGVALLVVLSMR